MAGQDEEDRPGGTGRLRHSVDPNRGDGGGTGESAPRRPAWRLAALIGTALVAVLAVIFMITGGRTVPPDDSAGGPESGPPTGGTTLTLDSLDFVDAHRGFALVEACNGDGLDCGHALDVTADGGATWTSRPVPWGASDEIDDSPRLYVFDATHLVLDAATGGQLRWASTNGGTTWKPVPRPGKGTVMAAPKGSKVVGEDRDYWNGGSGGPLFALSPDGTGHWLAHQPTATDGLDSDPVPGPDGTLWLSAADGTTQRVEFSQDAGRTWQSAPTPASATGACLIAAPALGGVYLGCAGDPNNAIYRTTDHGLSWQHITAPEQWTSMVAAPVTGAPLSTSDTGVVYRMGTDDRFVQVPDAPQASALAAAGQYAVLVTGVSDSLAYYISPDGETWQQIMPPGQPGPSPSH